MCNEFWLGIYFGGALLTVLYWFMESKDNTAKDNRNRFFMMVFWPIVILAMIGAHFVYKNTKK